MTTMTYHKPQHSNTLNHFPPTKYAEKIRDIRVFRRGEKREYKSSTSGHDSISFVHCILAACTPIPCSEECPVADPGGERGSHDFTQMLGNECKA